MDSNTIYSCHSQYMAYHWQMQSSQTKGRWLNIETSMAIRKFRRNITYNIPLWVLIRMKGGCLRNRWDKCYIRCIVKFF